jgi:DNA mismatch repair protein MSH4
MPSIASLSPTRSESASQASQGASSADGNIVSTKRKTKGSKSTTSGKQSSSNGGFWIVAVAEGRSQGETGIAALDLRTSSCYLSQFQDSATYVKTLYKLYTYDPVEVRTSISRPFFLDVLLTSTPSNRPDRNFSLDQIVVSNTTVEPSKSKLVRLIVDQMDVEIVPVARKAFNSEAGIQFIDQYGIQEEQQDLIPHLATKYFCLTACGALLQYVEAARGVRFSSSSIRFQWTAVEGSMVIDQVTARSLELVQNLEDPRSKDSLLGILDRSQTPMGRRLLRMAILQPSTDETTINTRLDAVDELIANEQTFFSIQTCW